MPITKQLKKHIADEIHNDSRKVYISDYKTEQIKDKNNSIVNVKLSPLQQLVLYIHQNFMDLSRVRRVGNLVLNEIFGPGLQITPGSPDDYINNENVVFVLQSKFLYVNSPASKVFMEIILPNLAARAEEKNGFLSFQTSKTLVTVRFANTLIILSEQLSF